MLYLLACTPALVGPAGPDTLRAALLFPDSEQEWLLLANSYLPCDGETPDNPHTVEDEAATSILYQQAQVATAFTREGALVIAFEVPGSGDWEVGTEAQAAWLYVEESMRYGQDGMISDYLPTLLQKDLAVDQGEIHLDGTDGDFDLSQDGLSGHFRATRCEDDTLRQEIGSQLTALTDVILN